MGLHYDLANGNYLYVYGNSISTLIAETLQTHTWPEMSPAHAKRVATSASTPVKQRHTENHQGRYPENRQWPEDGVCAAPSRMCVFVTGT